jgi:hypothetical protein
MAQAHLEGAAAAQLGERAQPHVHVHLQLAQAGQDKAVEGVPPQVAFGCMQALRMQQVSIKGSKIN